MEISLKDAEKYSKSTKSLMALRRLLSPTPQQPEWAKPDKARELLPILLVEKFNESKEGDKEIISEIAQLAFKKYVASLKKMVVSS